jgi:hypothetical protein
MVWYGMEWNQDFFIIIIFNVTCGEFAFSFLKKIIYLQNKRALIERSNLPFI